MDIAYNLSPRLSKHLEEIDEARKVILMTVLPLSTMQYLRWEAGVERLYGAMRLVDQPMSKKDIIRLITSSPKKQYAGQEREALAYKQVIDDISWKWLAVKKPVTVATLERFAQTLRAGKIGKGEEQMERTVSYIQQSPDHPVVSAGIAFAQSIRLSAFPAKNQRMAWVSSYLFLYKGGYNIQDLLALEEAFSSDTDLWESMVDSLSAAKNLTIWLEYFSKEISAQIQRIQSRIHPDSSTEQVEVPGFFWKLTDRQKELLVLMDQPGVRITNKKVQKGWGVSAITASRELAKLASIGLISAHGKGRSVYYTRV